MSPELPDLARYRGHVNHPAIGTAGHSAIRGGRVLVVGAGGLAAPAVAYLAAAGVGMLGLVDADQVSPTNLARQFLFTPADVGSLKVAVLADWVAAHNPQVKVRKHAFAVTAANAAALVSAFDVVLDTTDNSASRYVLDQVCGEQQKPLVWGAISAGAGCFTVLHAAPTPVSLRDIFPVPGPAEADGACATAGVVGPLCGVLGSRMAAEALRLLTVGASPAAGVLQYTDAFGVPAASYRVAATTVPESAPTITVAAFGQLQQSASVTVLDVRSAEEVSAGSIPGAHLVPLAEVTAQGVAIATAADGPVVVYCAGGDRAEVAAETLRAAGVRQARALIGGYSAWLEQQQKSVGSIGEAPA